MPINPSPPPPPVGERIAATARRYERQIEVIALGAGLGFLIYLTRPDVPVLGLMVVMAYVVGAIAEYIVLARRA